MLSITARIEMVNTKIDGQFPGVYFNALHSSTAINVQFSDNPQDWPSYCGMEPPTIASKLKNIKFFKEKIQNTQNSGGTVKITSQNQQSMSVESFLQQLSAIEDSLKQQQLAVEPAGSSSPRI